MMDDESRMVGWMMAIVMIVVKIVVKMVVMMENDDGDYGDDDGRCSVR